MNSKDFIGSQNQVFDIVITDGDENQIDTNGLNIQLSILCYQKDDYTELAKQDIYIKHLNKLYDLEEKKKEI